MNKKLLNVLVIMMIMLVSISIIGYAAEYDFEGDTIKIGTWLDLERYTEGSRQEHVKAIEEEYNVNLEFKDGWTQQIDEFPSSVMAGDPVVDVIEPQTFWAVSNFIPQEILLPLNQYLDEEYFDSLPFTDSEEAKNYCEVAGNYYMFSSNGGTMDEFKFFGGAQFLVWNKEIFEEQNLPDLYELYQEGEWTWDKFLDIAEEATIDSSANDEVEQFGVSFWHNWLVFAEDFMVANGGDIARMVDGEVKYTMNEEPVIEALDFYRKLKDYIDFENAGGGHAQFEEEKSAMLIAPLAGLPLLAQNTDFEYSLVFLPKAPNNDECVAYAPGTNALALPITTERPEALIDLMNALFKLTDEYRNFDTLKEDLIEEYSMHLRDRESMEIIRDAFDKYVIAPNYRNVFYDNTQISVYDEIMRDEIGISAGLAELEPEIQTRLDEMFNDVME